MASSFKSISPGEAFLHNHQSHAFGFSPFPSRSMIFCNSAASALAFLIEYSHKYRQVRSVHFRVLRHVVSQLILCEIVESHQLCLFQTKSKHLFQHFLVVIGIATVTQAGICLIDILSQFTVLGILEQRVRLDSCK